MEKISKKPQSGIFGSIRLNKTKYLDKLKELHSEGYNDTQIAEYLGVSLWSANSWRRKLGLEKNFKYKHKFDEEKFKELYDKGLSYAKIAKELNVSDSAIQAYGQSLGLESNAYKYDKIEFTEEEFQVFLGTIYGDGHLGIPSDSRNARGSFAHSLKQENYCKWKAEKLKRFCSKPRYEEQYDKRTNKIYKKIHYIIYSNPIFTELYPLLYTNKIKYINKSLFSKIEPLGLAVLFMDDGYYDHESYSISTNCFTEEDLKIILEVLLEKFNLHFTIHKNHVIRLKKCDSIKFINLIKEYIHPDCWYKLHIDPPKTPLNRETPEKLDNPVLNPQETEENAERLEVTPNE